MRKSGCCQQELIAMLSRLSNFFGVDGLEDAGEKTRLPENTAREPQLCSRRTLCSFDSQEMKPDVLL